MKFAIRMSPLVRPFLLFIGATAANSYVEVGAEEVRLRFSPAFDHAIRRDNIAEVVPGRWSIFDGFGVRAGGRIVGLIGSTTGVVEINTRESVTLPFAGWPWTVRIVAVSLEDPDGFIATVGNAAMSGPPASSTAAT